MKQSQIHLAMLVTSSVIAVAVSGFPGGLRTDHARGPDEIFSDDFESGDTTAWSLTETPPVVEIDSPLNGSIFTVDTVIDFSGHARHAAEGDLTIDLEWTSSLSGSIGMGGSFQVTLPSPGVHLITALVSDSLGREGSSSVEVHVFDVDPEVMPLGPELTVAEPPPPVQNRPSAAADATGNFVVVWNREEADGDGFDVIGERFDPAGTTTHNILMNTYTTGDQANPDVAVAADGSFVVAWQSDEFTGQDSSSILGRCYASNVNPLGNDFLINTSTPGRQTEPSIAFTKDGAFVVIWQSDAEGDSFYEHILGQRYGSDCQPLGGEFQVNSSTTNSQTHPALDSDAEGRFVVTWQSTSQDSYGDIFLRRYDSGGNALSGETPVNSYTTNSQARSSVAVDAAGDFVVVWESRYQDGDGYGIFARCLDSAGQFLGGDFMINSYTTGDQTSPSVVAIADGTFIVASRRGMPIIRGHQVFRGEGACTAPAPLGFSVSESTELDQPVIAAQADGRFVVVWEDRETLRAPANTSAIRGQRFESTTLGAIFSDGFESGDTSAW